MGWLMEGMQFTGSGDHRARSCSSDGALYSQPGCFIKDQFGACPLDSTMVKDKNNDIPVIVVEPPVTPERILYADENTPEDTLNELTPSECNRLRRKSLRRNSVSLPADLDILELESLRAAENQVSLRSDFSVSDVDDSEDEHQIKQNRGPVKVPPRNARKKSVIDRNMLKPGGDDDSDNNGNSITSVNSLASLLREKMQAFPSVLKKKKPPTDYKIRVFVIALFMTIVCLVCLAYVLYHQKVLQRAYFEKIKFSKANRIMRIFNADGTDVIIKGHLGMTLNYEPVYPCLGKDKGVFGDESICLEWMERARVYLKLYVPHNDVRCYNIHWVSLRESVSPTDCFEWDQASNGFWFGGGQTADSAWPLQKGHMPFTPFVTGKVSKHAWGNVLKRYFLNSKGAAIVVDKETPLHISINYNGKKEFCLQARHDNFAYANHITELPHLNYSICTSSNMTKLHSLMTEKSLWDGLKQNEMEIVYSLLAEPLWEITAASKTDFTEGTVYNYTEDVIALGFLKQGHVLINEFWQKQVGDFHLDVERFPSLEDTINIMHRRGFRIVFSVQPFVSTESPNFAECVSKHLLISERAFDRRIPALTRYKSAPSAGVLDVTNNRTMPWLLEKLKALTNKYKIDSFYLDLGVAYDMPRYYQCEKPLINPDQYKTLFTNSLQGNVNIFGVNSAVDRPRVPAFVSMPSFESSWEGLRSVIPSILTYGMMGFPYLIPGAVGGDFDPPGQGPSVSVNVTSGERDIVLPDKELYVRWLQLATFLPVVRFTHLPSKYGDEKLLDMAKLLTSLRQKTVTPLLKKYASDALDSGLPLIRPLWMLEANDPSSHVVSDEFSVGDELIVAPVLHSGMREREVYLPAGVWKDGIDGSLRKGSRWIHDYRVSEDQVAYFVKMPDNTRF